MVRLDHWERWPWIQNASVWLKQSTMWQKCQMQICGNVAGFVAAGLKAAALTLLLLLLLHLLPGSSLDLQFWCTYFISYLVLSSYLVPNVSDCGKATAAKHLQMLNWSGRRWIWTREMQASQVPQPTLWSQVSWRIWLDAGRLWSQMISTLCCDQKCCCSSFHPLCAVNIAPSMFTSTVHPLCICTSNCTFYTEHAHSQIVQHCQNYQHHFSPFYSAAGQADWLLVKLGSKKCILRPLALLLLSVSADSLSFAK